MPPGICAGPPRAGPGRTLPLTKPSAPLASHHAPQWLAFTSLHLPVCWEGPRGPPFAFVPASVLVSRLNAVSSQCWSSLQLFLWSPPRRTPAPLLWGMSQNQHGLCRWRGAGRVGGGGGAGGQASGPHRLAVLLICIWCPPFTSHDEALMGPLQVPCLGSSAGSGPCAVCPSFPGGRRAMGHGPYPGGLLLPCLTIKARAKLLPRPLTLTVVQSLFA